MDEKHLPFMQEAIRLSVENVKSGSGGPFGAVVVKGNTIVGKGVNLVTRNNDPTAHAEVQAIREACQHLETFDLSGCVIYSSCEPCPMCLSAIYWAKIGHIYFGNSRIDAAEIGFNDKLLYDEIPKSLTERHIPIQQMSEQQAKEAFELWLKDTNRIDY